MTTKRIATENKIIIHFKIFLKRWSINKPIIELKKWEKNENQNHVIIIWKERWAIDATKINWGEEPWENSSWARQFCLVQ